MSNASTIRCLITAGPTREYFDPARFLSNPSTGKMGFAIAEAALEMGWTVDLVAGPVDLQEPDGAILYPVTSADEMLQQVDALFDACDLLIMTAAVADFRPAARLPQKEKKAQAARSLALQPTVDILKTMVQRRRNKWWSALPPRVSGSWSMPSRNCWRRIWTGLWPIRSASRARVSLGTRMSYGCWHAMGPATTNTCK